MNHLKQIAARLPEYGLDAMLLNSEPGEYYAVGFHGEGNVVVTAQGCFTSPTPATLRLPITSSPARRSP